MNIYNVWIDGPNGKRQYKISGENYAEVRRKAQYAIRNREKVESIKFLKPSCIR